MFNLITDDHFLGTADAHLPAHRERLYPSTETLAMFAAQVLSDDSSCQRAVNDRIIRCLQQGLRPSATSGAAYCKARARLSDSLLETLFQAVGGQVGEDQCRR